MNMRPVIKTLPEKHFIGKYLNMSFAQNRTFELWHSFMPKRKTIPNQVGIELYSIEIYPPGFYDNFNSENRFEKWAAVEVFGQGPVPEGLESLTVTGGSYAVFDYKGPASEGAKTYQYIFGVWLPQSDFVLDQRPHFAVMGEKYKNDDPDSEEELLIPVKPRYIR